MSEQRCVECGNSKFAHPILGKQFVCYRFQPAAEAEADAPEPPQEQMQQVVTSREIRRLEKALEQERAAHAEAYSNFLRTAGQLNEGEAQLAALSGICDKLEADREYNAELVRERDAQLATLREALAKADKQLRDADKATRRNALITNEKGFVGAWVAMPKENFDKLRAALRGQPAKGHAR